MIAIDTNILVRIVTNDHPEQVQVAVNFLFNNKAIFISKTVILELE
jgi:predicted nucleic-acid-binding protein